MKSHSILIFLIVAALFSINLKAEKTDISELPLNPQLKVKAYTGFYRFVDDYGDTVRMTIIRDIVVYPPMKF